MTVAAAEITSDFTLEVIPTDYGTDLRFHFAAEVRADEAIVRVFYAANHPSVPATLYLSALEIVPVIAGADVLGHVTVRRDLIARIDVRLVTIVGEHTLGQFPTEGETSASNVSL